MKKTNKSEEKEARKLVTLFTHEFHSKFRVYPTIIYDLSKRDEYLLNLTELITLTDELLNADLDIDLIKQENRSVKAKCRQSLVVTYRGCLIHVARRLNYSYSELHRALGQANHTTVLHAHKRINNLLDTKDFTVTHIYKQLENELKTRYGITGDVQSDSATGINA